MKQTEFISRLNAITPEAPEHFSRHVDHVLEKIVRQEEEQMDQTRAKRLGRRTLALVLAALLAVGSAALAAGYWGIFDALSHMLGSAPAAQDAQPVKVQHTETINNVEITIREAAYDGRTLFIQYSYRLLGETQPFGITDAEGNLQEGLPYEALQKLDACNIGWWVDHFWVNDQCMDMAANSGAVDTGTLVPGEILRTEYWRLDNLDVSLTGQVTVALPIGEKQPLVTRLEHPECFDADGNMLKPEKGLVSFTFDCGDMQQKIRTFAPSQQLVTPVVTVKVTEAAFTPLMSYITLSLEGSPEALERYKAVNGEGFCDSEGNLIFPYTQADVHHSYIASLALVDGSGQQLFPGHLGLNGVGDSWAEFLYPSLAELPEELWLAPVQLGTADLENAIRIK